MAHQTIADGNTLNSLFVITWVENCVDAYVEGVWEGQTVREVRGGRFRPEPQDGQKHCFKYNALEGITCSQGNHMLLVVH